MIEDFAQELPIFIYGTLLPGQPNHHLWGNRIARQEAASLHHGCLYDMIYYPMLVDAPGIVQGMIVTVQGDHFAAVMDALDNLEGFDPREPEASAYRRVRREVKSSSSGESITAWTYIGKAEYVRDAPLVPGGDWVAFSRDKNAEMLTWWESIDTVFGRHQ